MAKLSSEEWKAKRADCRMMYFKCRASILPESKKSLLLKFFFQSPRKMLRSVNGMVWNSSPNRRVNDWNMNSSTSEKVPS